MQANPIDCCMTIHLVGRLQCAQHIFSISIVMSISFKFCIYKLIQEVGPYWLMTVQIFLSCTNKAKTNPKVARSKTLHHEKPIQSLSYLIRFHQLSKMERKIWSPIFKHATEKTMGYETEKEKLDEWERVVVIKCIGLLRNLDVSD